MFVYTYEDESQMISLAVVNELNRTVRKKSHCTLLTVNAKNNPNNIFVKLYTELVSMYKSMEIYGILQKFASLPAHKMTHFWLNKIYSQYEKLLFTFHENENHILFEYIINLYRIYELIRHEECCVKIANNSLHLTSMLQES